MTRTFIITRKIEVGGLQVTERVYEGIVFGNNMAVLTDIVGNNIYEVGASVKTFRNEVDLYHFVYKEKQFEIHWTKKWSSDKINIHSEKK